MSSPTAAVPAIPAAASPGALSAEVDRVWPLRPVPMPTAVLGGASLAGLVAAVLLPDSPAGLGVLIVGLLVGAAVLPTVLTRLTSAGLTLGTLAVLLLGVVALRSAEWVVSLSLLASAGLASCALSGGRTLVSVVLGGLSLPLAFLRGLPWFAHGIRTQLPARRTQAALRAVLVTAGTLAVLLVFGALFASADAAFAALLPSPDLPSFPARAIVFCLVFGLSVTAAFLGASPPQWDVLAPQKARCVRPAEWIIPIAALDALFVVFVTIQLSVLFGGNDHVVRTAGLTYAEYARSGFGQLVTVTLLTLAVVAAAARWAPRETASQRAWLRALLGSLCGLSLVVVGSALYRLHLYEEAFGFTRLRLFMNVFETSLGVVLLLVLVAGIRLQGSWLPRAVVVTGALAMLTLTLLNPDSFVANRNIERYAATGKVDAAYLQGLSADAVPAVDRLSEPLRSCVLSDIKVAPDRGFAGWNLGRHRARDVLERRPISRADASAVDCVTNYDE